VLQPQCSRIIRKIGWDTNKFSKKDINLNSAASGCFRCYQEFMVIFKFAGRF